MKLVDLSELLTVVEAARAQGKRIVWTNGCFDLLHAGHVQCLEASRAQGDLLIVGVNSDASVRRLKGPARPILPEEDRVEILCALASVDHVLLFDGPTPEPELAQLKPDYFCKGSDCADPGPRFPPEAGIVESYGGRVVFIPVSPGVSTTGIVEKICAGE